MIHKECDNGNLARGIGKCSMRGCNNIIYVDYAYCEECSEKLNLCVKCGQPLEKNNMKLPKSEMLFNDDGSCKLTIDGISFEESEMIQKTFMEICGNRRKEMKPERYDGTNGNGYQPLDDGNNVKNPPKEE